MDLSSSQLVCALSSRTFVRQDHIANAFTSTEAQADYMLKWCDRWQTENIRSFTPKWDAIEDFIEYSDKFMQGTVWTENCSSWYKGNSVTGRVSALWPGSTLSYM